MPMRFVVSNSPYAEPLWYNRRVINEPTSTLPKIGLNAHLLSLSQSYRSAGISWYIYNLLTQLTRVEPAYQYTAFAGDRTFESQHNLAVQLSRWPTHKPLVRIAWEQAVLPLALKQAKVDLLHALAFVAPLAAPCRFVTTIYDLSFVRYPEAFKPFNRWYLNTFTRLSSRKADAIITISESTRRDVIRFFGISPSKVHTIYCGVDGTFKPLPQADVDAFRAERGLPDRFIFRLGTIEPRKNVEGVIRAYAEWYAADKSAPPLVIAGGKGWYYRQAFQLVEDLGLTEKISFPGYLPQEELPLWYNAADMLVYPSHFEGFGLPVLEAMACGTPVITSNVSSLPEVAGDAAIMVDPKDIAALSRAMRDVFLDRERAEAMRQAGLIRAAQFSWRKAARQTVQVYQQILNLKS